MIRIQENDHVENIEDPRASAIASTVMTTSRKDSSTSFVS